MVRLGEPIIPIRVTFGSDMNAFQQIQHWISRHPSNVAHCHQSSDT